LIVEATPTTLYAELWVSLASLLRSYTALHGLHRKQQATVELGEDLITVRAGEKWLRLTRRDADFVWSREDASNGRMRFTIDGRLEAYVGEEGLDANLERQGVEQQGVKEQGLERQGVEEMDLQVESWARELMQ
jgi:hypothetical protein